MLLLILREKREIGEAQTETRRKAAWERLGSLQTQSDRGERISIVFI